MIHERRWRVVPILGVVFATLSAVNVSAQTAELRWGGDAEGGAPFVEADPKRSCPGCRFRGRYRRDLLARGLARAPRFIQTGFTTIDAAVVRGDFDIGLSGIEDSAARRARLAVTIPYYQFREVLTVRDTDALRFRTLADLRGRRVATLGVHARARIAHGRGRRRRRRSGDLRGRRASVQRSRDRARGCRAARRGARQAWRWPQSRTDQSNRRHGHGLLRRYPGAGERRLARSDRRDSHGGDAHGTARRDLQTLGHVERRPAAAVREGSRQPAGGRVRHAERGPRHTHVGRDSAVPAIAPERGRNHPEPFGALHGARHRRRGPDCEREECTAPLR